MSIHPTAILGKNVTLGSGNEIGPRVVIEDGVSIGNGNKISSGAYICAGTEIGNQNEIHMGAVIGNTPQDLAYQGALTFTKIGSENIIREYVTIHRGTQAGTATTVGDHNFLMVGAHLGHNCEIANHIIIVNNSTLGGYVTVEDGAFISGTCVVHQFCRIGRLAIVSGLSAVNKDIPPYMLCAGRNSVIHSLNVVGLRRSDFSGAVRNEIKRAYKLLYRSGLNNSEALTEIEKICTSDEVRHLVHFVRNSKRGICAAGDAAQARDRKPFEAFSTER